MNSKERILAAWAGRPSDHVPLTTWCFGFPAPAGLGWKRDGVKIRFWYSLRMEHIHTILQPWDLEDDFRRVLAWQSLGLDDLLDVSVPWGQSQEVTRTDSRISATESSSGKPILVREYHTPAGTLRHAVRQTQEEQGDGWVVQPDFVPLIEDFNIPRAERHLVSLPEDVPKLKYLYKGPDETIKRWFTERMDKIGRFAAEHCVPVQAWSAFGIDAAVWFTGPQNAVLMSIDHPQAFAQLLDIITEADLERTELAASCPGVDMIVERGWYSSTDFWSPQLFDEFLYPHIQALAQLCHRYGKRFGYVMTTGVDILGPRLADAGVDVLYFIDPLDVTRRGASLLRIRELLADRLTLVGGTSSLTLASGDPVRIEGEVRQALEILGPTHRFIMHAVDALFPDTPWEGLQRMIDVWREYR